MALFTLTSQIFIYRFSPPVFPVMASSNTEFRSLDMVPLPKCPFEALEARP